MADEMLNFVRSPLVATIEPPIRVAQMLSHRLCEPVCSEMAARPGTFKIEPSGAAGSSTEERHLCRGTVEIITIEALESQPWFIVHYHVLTHSNVRHFALDNRGKAHEATCESFYRVPI